MSILLNGDCLEELSMVEDNSVDFIFCDLPYGQTSCKWDIIIPWEPFWKEIMRVKKINTPIFFTTTTKFGVNIINNAPKKCPFRYDLVWVKSSPAGFLSAKKMPMRKHELIYVFYEKLPFYDLSSHKHKFIKEVKHTEPEPELCQYDVNNNTYGGGKEGRIKITKNKEDHQQKYNPPLPTSVVKEECKIVKRTDEGCNGLYGKEENKVFIYDENGKLRNSEPRYDPPLPTTLLEVKSTKGKHATEKPVALVEWLLKYYSKEGDTVLDPTMGSGTTGVACKKMNRNFIGIEKDTEIYEVAVNRIEE
jgi:DNA modification methylase